MPCQQYSDLEWNLPKADMISERIRAGIKRELPYLVIGGLSTTILIQASFDRFVRLPADYRQIMDNVPSCQGFNSNFADVEKRFNVIIDGPVPLDQIAIRPDFQQPLECYRVARRAFYAAGLERRSGSTPLGIVTGIAGLVAAVGARLVARNTPSA